jgi:hypothetical protein
MPMPMNIHCWVLTRLLSYPDNSLFFFFFFAILYSTFILIDFLFDVQDLP